MRNRKNQTLMKKLTLSDLFSLDDFYADVDNGFIRVQTHPTLPLCIANYTEKATFARHWRATTLRSRGLIYEQGLLTVIAGGPAKFFNVGEPSAPAVPLDALVRPTTKHDGSLGIAYKYGDHYGIATRGSFASDQAIHATELLRRSDLMPDIDYADTHQLTRIFEIVYPENRIVLDYGDRDELIKLGTVVNDSGVIAYRPRQMYVSGTMTLGEAIALPVPDDEEGYVLDVHHDGKLYHLKLKGDRYKELHSVIFGLNERKIWEVMKSGAHKEFIEALPDELQDWATNVLTRLSWEYLNYSYDIEAITLAPEFTDAPSRKELAGWIMSHYPQLSSPLFLAADDRWDRVQDWIFDKIYPAHAPFKSEPILS